MTASLAYRKHEAAILRGNVPDKYTRILPHIPRGKIVELGSAEGVLALLLAKRGDRVTAIERSRARWEAAMDLAKRWDVPNVMFALGDAALLCKDVPDVGHPLDNAEALVAVRMIYYLGDQLDTIFAEIAKHVPTVVLCGNRNRAESWRSGYPHAPLGDFNRYAASEGMIEVLERHGYQAEIAEKNGDEIVIGRRG